MIQKGIKTDCIIMENAKFQLHILSPHEQVLVLTEGIDEDDLNEISHGDFLHTKLCVQDISYDSNMYI